MAALVARSILWPRRRTPWPLAICFLAGLAITIAIERWAVSAGRWEDGEEVPTIAGIGLTPDSAPYPFSSVTAVPLRCSRGRRWSATLSWRRPVW